MKAVVATSALLAASAPAHALKQSAHRSISWHACRDAGLPRAFCDRLGVAAYDVDRYEWNTPAAHAQAASGQSMCDGADATLARVRDLGSSVRDDLARLAAVPSADRAEQVAVNLGRALHTVQDNCAHRGLPNDQHAWDSMSDICVGTKLSPDTRPDALACARDETELIMDAFLTAMDDAGVDDRNLSDVPQGNMYWPEHEDVCDFLASANDWDGQDRHWNNQVMSPALRDQLTAAMTSAEPATVDVCADGGSALAAPDPDAPVDVAAGAPSCPGISIYCLGKADGADEPPPWDDGSTGDEDLQPAGCAAGGGNGAGAAALLLALAGLVATRRRRA